MSASFACPHCGAVSNVDSDDVGKSGLCRECGKEIVMPSQNIRAPRGSSGSAEAISSWIIGCGIISVLCTLIVGAFLGVGLWIRSLQEQERRLMDAAKKAAEVQARKSFEKFEPGPNQGK